MPLEGADGVYELVGVLVERVIEEGEAIAVEARPTAPGAACPSCGQTSERVHSRYVRTRRDLSASGRGAADGAALRLPGARLSSSHVCPVAPELEPAHHCLAPGRIPFNVVFDILVWPTSMLGNGPPVRA